MNDMKESIMPISERLYNKIATEVLHKTPEECEYIKLMNTPIDEDILTGNMKFKRVDDIAGYPCYTNGRFEISETEYGFIVHPNKDRVLKKVKDLIGIAYPGAFFLIV